MKRIQTLIACLIALAFVGMATINAADSGDIQGKAIVRAIHGTVDFSTDGTTWNRLRVNMELDPGVKIRTAPDSYCNLNINGSASAVRVAEDTIMAVPTMSRTGESRDSDTTTMLDLQSGTILGNVKKLAGNSRYEITTPHGVAGIRGTDFQVVVTLGTDGRVVVTFTSVTGEVLVSAVIDGNTVVKVLHDGESWTPGNGDVAPTPLQVLQSIQVILTEMMNPLSVLPPPIPIIHPFPTGGTPGGHQSSPSGNP